MAGAGYKLFNTGDVLTAAQVNTYLQEQVVMVFANAAARTTALTSVLAEGMISYLKDTNVVEVYDGSAWVGVANSGDITAVTAGTGITGGGTSGAVTITNDMATKIDAKGDLIVGTGADTYDRLAVGATAGHVLTVDSTQATGMKWAAVSAGGANWSLVNAGGTALTAAATITVSGISNADKILVIIAGASSASASSVARLRFNSDSGSTYYPYGPVIESPSTYSANSVYSSTGANTGINLGAMSASASSVMSGYAIVTGCNSSGVKVFHAAGAGTPASSNTQVGYWFGGYYDSSSAITSVSIVSLSGNFDAGTIYVYTSA